MKLSNRMLCTAAAAFCGAAPAAAQTADQANGKEIVVEAPRAVPPPPQAERSAFTGAPIITTTVRIYALYGDLDLTQPAHAARLMIRVESVARDACLYLDRLYPLTPDPDCVGRAVASAAPAAKAVIATAGK